MELNTNGVSHIPKSTVVCAKGREVGSIAVILKGKMLTYNNGLKILLGPGDLIGAADLCTGSYETTTYALEDASVFALAAKTVEDVETMLESKQNYRGATVMGMSRFLAELYKTEKLLRKEAELLYTTVKGAYGEYEKLQKQVGEKLPPLSELEELEEYPAQESAEEEEKTYYVDSVSIPVKVQDEFYSHSMVVCSYHIRELTLLLKDTMEQCMELTEYCNQVSDLVFSEKREDCLYKETAKLGMNSIKAGVPKEPFLNLLVQLQEKLMETEQLLRAKTGCKMVSKVEQMKQLQNMVLEAGNSAEGEMSVESAVKYASIDTDKIMEELSGSLKKILDYAEYDEEKAKQFTEEEERFLMMKDKNDTSDASRKMRRQLAEYFYEIYEAVFRKVYRSRGTPKLIDLFLNYGYMDERLLEKEQLLELYHLEKIHTEAGSCKVYGVKDWLVRVYEGVEEPSKSEFDLEYTESLRDRKKSGEITEEEKKQLETDQDAKLVYEIRNMFHYNNRLVSGQLSVFVPILYKDLFMGHLEQAYVTAEKVNDWIRQITDIDYSVFYREVLFEDREKKIDRESIMLEVFPNIILLPTYGANAVMWQEIAGKRRTASGRILLPVFAEGNMWELMIKTIARFRWELCRTVQGMSWNDINERSLTSEYCDYVQFYKKNRDLSEDKRDKLKSQIQKCKGNTREVFASDYLIWIKHESQGSVRLNKVAREMLATYCPFTKDIRIKMQQQPIFEEAFSRYNREKAHRIKNLDSKYRYIENNGGELVEELQNTLKYYKEL